MASNCPANIVKLRPHLGIHRPEELILGEERSATLLTGDGCIPLPIHGLMDRLQELE